jgi:imidazole glycerol-phosphate synthase subunit HisH
VITIVDYGLGNVQAIANIYKRLSIPVTIATSAEKLSSANKIILPGVGAFDWAMSRLNESGMRPRLDELVRSGSEVLGICVGMQMMAKRSQEGALDGLGWIEAEVKIFDREKVAPTMLLPHMGWNDVSARRTDSLFRGIEGGARFYFLHSYYFAPQHAGDVIALADYYAPFACAVQVGNVYGVQFHPEKSHHWGIQLLKNFAEM